MSILLTPAWGYSVTRASWRSLLRAELGDENPAAYLWGTALLNEWLNEAIRDYGRVFPREETTTLAAVASQAAYDLPIGFVEVVRVEHPTNTFRVYEPRAGGEWRRGTDVTPSEDRLGGRYAYDVWRGQLALEPAPTAGGESIVVRYTTRRAEPTADSDPLPVEGGDEELLLLYAAARALAWIGTQEGKRQAFERQRGADAGTLAERYQQRYAAGLAARRRTGNRARRLVLREV